MFSTSKLTKPAKPSYNKRVGKLESNNFHFPLDSIETKTLVPDCREQRREVHGMTSKHDDSPLALETYLPR
jgi:hypothetical protein